MELMYVGYFPCIECNTGTLPNFTTPLTRDGIFVLPNQPIKEVPTIDGETVLNKNYATRMVSTVQDLTNNEPY